MMLIELEAAFTEARKGMALPEGHKASKAKTMMTGRSKALGAGVALCAASVLLAPVAYAQDLPPATNDGRRSFTPDYFASFGPVNALDMVRRIPGFTIEQSEGRRGFGENAGNVLIDGDRPSSKSDDIDTILTRIPASQVERIELIEQAGGDGEAQGKGQLVNVIRKSGSATSGTYEIGATKSLERKAYPVGSGSVSIKRGQTTYEANVGFYSEGKLGKGPETFRDGAGRLVERRNYIGASEYRQFSFGGAIKTRMGGAKINLNGQGEWSNGLDRRFGQVTGPAGAFIGTEFLFTDEPINDFEFEVGGDIEFPLAANLNTKLIGLYQHEDDQEAGQFGTARSGVITLFATRNESKPTEAVFRIQNDWSGVKSHAIQFGAELAYNRLDARFSSQEFLNGASLGSEASNVLVRETRLEPFISDVWTISPKWKLEAGAIFEFSKLQLSGASAASRSFQFAKPRLVATWTATKETTFEFRAERQVAQLDFDEFATSVDLGQGNLVDAGNQDLVPEQVTTFSALVRRKFFDRGSIQLLGSYELIKDTQDLVPVEIVPATGPRFFVDGAGNIGKGRKWNAELEITLPFDWLTKSFGVTGMELKYVGHYHGSRVTDPVTGQSRRVSFRPEWHQTYEFRHDLAKVGIAYGFTINTQSPVNASFVSQFRRQRNLTDAQVFIEYRKLKWGTVRLRAFHIGGSPFERQRLVYVGTRAGSVVTQIIDRRRELNTQFELTLSGKF